MNSRQKEAFLSYGRNALIAQKLYGMTRVEVKAKSLPYKYASQGPNEFPREDSYLLFHPNSDEPAYWVPGYINDCYVHAVNSPDERQISGPPHFFDEDFPSRQMEKRIFEMGLENRYILELWKIMTQAGKNVDGAGALMTANCEQRGQAAWIALELKEP